MILNSRSDNKSFFWIISWISFNLQSASCLKLNNVLGWSTLMTCYRWYEPCRQSFYCHSICSQMLKECPIAVSNDYAAIKIRKSLGEIQFQCEQRVRNNIINKEKNSLLLPSGHSTANNARVIIYSITINSVNYSNRFGADSVKWFLLLMGLIRLVNIVIEKILKEINETSREFKHHLIWLNSDSDLISLQRLLCNNRARFVITSPFET